MISLLFLFNICSWRNSLWKDATCMYFCPCSGMWSDSCFPDVVTGQGWAGATGTGTHRQETSTLQDGQGEWYVIWDSLLYGAINRSSDWQHLYCSWTLTLFCHGISQGLVGHFDDIWSRKIIDSQRNLKECISNLIVITAPADDLAPVDARTSAGTVMNKLQFCMYRRLADTSRVILIYFA